MKKILILAANPLDSVRLSLEREIDEIRTTLQLSANRDRFTIETRGAVRPEKLQQYMYDLKPQIVHFSGHGIGSGATSEDLASKRKFTVITDAAQTEGLVFEDEDGRSKLVSGLVLSDLFKLFSQELECVVLNSCYSIAQAREIRKHIPYVVGMNRAIGDFAARKFSQGFYRAIWDDRSIAEALASGKSAISLDGIPEELTPVLLSLSIDNLAPRSPIAANLENPEGAVRIDSRFYIPSGYEERCDREVQKPGALIRIKSPCGMGKSSLMLRVLDRATKLGYRSVALDLRQTNQKFFNDLDKFMQWFCASVGKSLGVRVAIEEYWDDIFGANDNSTEYFEKYLLEGERQPLVVAIDNFDRVFEYPDIENDFCGLLRGWHENAKIKDLWNNLRLIIVHSQESYARRDINQSPFNVGWAIELNEFTPAQVKELITLHGLSWTEREIEQLMSSIGGHPDLVRQGLYHMVMNNVSLADFLATADTEAGIYRDHLIRHLNVFEQCPLLKTAMKTVITSDVPVRLPSDEAFKLDAMGLVTRRESNIQSRCQLYRQFFANVWEIDL